MPASKVGSSARFDDQGALTPQRSVNATIQEQSCEELFQRSELQMMGEGVHCGSLCRHPKLHSIAMH
jgi:hypothetical protein